MLFLGRDPLSEIRMRAQQRMPHIVAWVAGDGTIVASKNTIGLHEACLLGPGARRWPSPTVVARGARLAPAVCSAWVGAVRPRPQTVG